jgi:hypothetical protein
MSKNVVDRYLDTVNRLGLPKFGWIAHKSKFKSEARDIPTSFTGGFAKNIFLLRHDDVPFVIAVSDEVREVLTACNESTFNDKAANHRKRAESEAPSKKTAKAVAVPATIANPTPVNDEDKVAQTLIDAENDERLQKLREKKEALKEKFDSFRWSDVGFAGEAQTGTIGHFTFYFGPSSDDGRWFYKINDVSCSRKKNRNTLEEVKADAFESFWKIVLAREQKENANV